MAAIDAMLSLLFALGLAQLAWFSIMLRRRGIEPEPLLRSFFALLALWVLLWPLYAHPPAIFVALGLLLLLVLVAARARGRSARALRRAWSTAREGLRPLLSFGLALTLAAALFVAMPAWGLGIALALCLGEAAAETVEAAGRGLRLRFPANPSQTLPGHLLLILVAAICCAWSLRLYLGLPWLALPAASLLAGLAASAARGIAPFPWNLPAMVLAMGAAFAVL